MTRSWIIALFLLLLCGCGRQPARMDQPEDPDGRYRDQIAAARRLLEQKEDWADRAEWEVVKSGDGWEVIAWRVVHPSLKGGSRYVPWGYSVIQLDRRLVPVRYHRQG
jgi:hypothetical protein